MTPITPAIATTGIRPDFDELIAFSVRKRYPGKMIVAPASGTRHPAGIGGVYENLRTEGGPDP
jgi:hypothetical protein